MIDYIGLKNGIKALNNLLAREDARELFEDSNNLNEFAKLIRDNLCSDLAEINLEIQNGNHSNQYIPDIIPEGKRLLKLTDDLNGFPPMIIGQLICLRDSLQNVIEVWGSVCGAGKLPEVLNINEAKSILQKAIDAGFCDANYQWRKSKALLAYFADRVSEYLELGKGEYDGKAKTSWKPFESLFGISGLSGAKRDYQKTGTLPGGYKDVDTLFE